MIDARAVYAGNYEGLLEIIDREGMEHVKNATFVFEDIYNDQNRILIYYVKEIEKYDEFDLRQFANRVIELQKQKDSLEKKISDAIQVIGTHDKSKLGKDDFVK